MPKVPTITSQLDPEERKATLASFRSRALKMAFRAGWLMLVALFVAARFTGADLTSPLLWAPAAAMSTALVLLPLVDWDNAFRRRSGKVLILLGEVVFIASLGIMSTVPSVRDFVLIVYIGLVALAAAVAGVGMTVATTMVVSVLSLLMPFSFGNGLDVAEAVVLIVTLFVTAGVTSVVTSELHRAAYQGAAQLAELRARERDLEQVYEVSRTLGARRDLAEVLPELVGKISTYLNAEVGLVALRGGGFLEVLSPIWTEGSHLEVADYRLKPDSPLAEVVALGQPVHFQHIQEDPDGHGLLGELGLRSALAVPLQLEHRRLGVLVVGDGENREFNARDLSVLESLAGPAALLVAQLSRYEEAEQMGKRMQEVAQMKTDFVSVVSHELRTPLTSIIGSLATLARPELTPDSEAGKVLLDSARGQSDRLRRLIEDLLMVSRIDNRALPQHPTRLRMAPFLRQVVAGVPGADPATIETEEDLEIEVDADHLSRAISNLLENAIKHSKDTAVEVRATPADGSGVVLEVIDHGPGISSEDRERVFERFTQLDPAETRDRGGTGLGLSIVRSLVEALGGDIELVDTPGGGATFRVMLPSHPGARG